MRYDSEIMRWLMAPKPQYEFFTLNQFDFFEKLLGARKNLNIINDIYGQFCMFWFEDGNNHYSLSVQIGSRIWNTLKYYFPGKILILPKESGSPWQKIPWRGIRNMNELRQERKNQFWLRE